MMVIRAGITGGTLRGTYEKRRDDQRIDASTTVTPETTSPISQPSDLLDVMIAPIATPTPTIPMVTMSLTNARSAE